MIKGEDFFIEDFFEQIANLNIDYYKLSSEESKKIYIYSFELYFNNLKYEHLSESSNLWMNLKQHVKGKHLPFFAKDISQIFDYCNPKQQEIYLFFDTYYCQNIFLFNSFDDLSKIFKNTYNFNFYIVGKEIDTKKFLFSWSDEEYVFASGIAEKWLNDLKKSRDDL